MKNARKYTFMAAAALALLLSGCANNDDFTEASGGKRPADAVTVQLGAGSLSTAARSNAAATDDTQRWFNAGDQVSISASDGNTDQEAVIFQRTSTDDQTWTETVSGKYLLWTSDTLTFKAYYPANVDGTSMTAFTLPTDQSSVDKIALADYMTKTADITRPASGSDIQMQLERKMARVIVRISGFGSQYYDDEKTVSNVHIYSESSGIEDGNPTGSSTEITPYAQGTGGQGTSYTALVVPGYGDSGATFIQLTDGEGSTLRVKGIPELEAGYSYTFNLTVGKNTIQVQSVTVQDWTGETLTGEQAEEASATITVTWNNDDITGNSGTSFTKDGVTITAGMIDFRDKNFMEGGTFTTTLGNFTKIEVTTGAFDASGTGWSGSMQSATWTGNASSVSFSGDIMGMGGMEGDTKFVFTIEPTN
ncbi:MAG: fimbrillin family protein [Treponema sp.]|nr:fimbrillin family protein [Treponema sp.]